MAVDKDKSMVKHIGYVGVDSGMLMVGDPCYLKEWELWNDKSEEYDESEKNIGKYGYLGACATVSNNQAGTLGEGKSVIFQSGLGDGVYSIYALYDEDNETIAQVIIDFNNVSNWEPPLDDEENDEEDN
jgi:hypothetical protein